MNVLAGVIGAAVGLVGVLLGAWLNNLREDKNWLRDQKLQAAAQFIAAGGRLYDYRRKGKSEHIGEDMFTEWDHQMDTGRSVIHLLCEPDTVERANVLARYVFRARPDDEQHHEETIKALQEFTRSVRQEIIR